MFKDLPEGNQMVSNPQSCQVRGLLIQSPTAKASDGNAIVIMANCLKKNILFHPGIYSAEFIWYLVLSQTLY